MVGMNSGYIASLPAPVKRRLKSLKKIQLESTKIEAKFYEEVHKLECKYHEMYKPLYEQRGRITKGIKTIISRARVRSRIYKLLEIFIVLKGRF